MMNEAQQRVLPLEGISVLDLSRLTPGAYASMLLADVGCDVVKIEQPGRGDYMRTLVPGGFEGVNRSKRSLTLDLKAPEGRDILLRLVERADVVLESFRPGVADRLGVGYDSLRAANDTIIYCSLSGYGQTGRRRERTGHDLNYLGVSGALSLMGQPDGAPANVSRLVIADLNGGMFAFASILLALFAREHTRRSTHIDVSITDAMTSWMGRFLTEFQLRHGANRASMMRLEGYGVYRTADGFITLACIENEFWNSFVDALPFEHELKSYRTEEQRRANGERIDQLLDDLFVTATTGDWLARYAATDVPMERVNVFDDVFSDPGLTDRELFHPMEVDGESVVNVGFPIKLSGMGTRPMGRPPHLGEDTDEVLRGLGMPDDQIIDLRSRGVV